MTGLEILLLVLVLVGVLLAATIVRAISPFIVNAVVGLLVLFLANAVFALPIAVTPVVLLIVALGGVLGAIAVIVLALFGVAFVP
ncbi:pro-sigmaK processing inhibitor BofA family protein [Natronorubrum texcoconense]|uniref:SigmaK-factor processing regulatory protein BofA n=1 Tax=Natronorubrum texcoconense TaxID=1095776 RepID=A0A1G9BLX4_9EURY|nr:pro-sigmaK processing inhibitor BofA family protein [Natronorubrum texcoconense]SDK40491.1 SigmaK-factor processing regulatory protein BofA [Natronorubrum texcoconense]